MKRLGAGAIAAIIALFTLQGAAGAATTSPARTLTGSGFYDVVVGSPTAATAVYGCYATATPDATSTTIRSCTLVRNGVVVGSAPPVSLPGPAAATAGTTAFPLAGTSSLKVCWSVAATFIDSTMMSGSGCTLL